MPTPLGHSLWSISMFIFFRGKVKETVRFRKQEILLIVLCVCFGILPDLDILAVFIFQNRFLHRAFVHSFTFVFTAVLISGAILKSTNKIKRPFLLAFFLIGGHIFWDLFTNCDRIPYGTMVLYPFSRKFYQAPFVIFSGFDWTTVKGILSAAFIQQLSMELIVFLPFLFLAIFINKRRGVFGYESCFNQA